MCIKLVMEEYSGILLKNKIYNKIDNYDNQLDAIIRKDIQQEKIIKDLYLPEEHLPEELFKI